MWQWAIQRPGLVTCRSRSTVWPAGMSTVSFQTRLASGLAVPGEDEEAPGSVDVERVMHRVIASQLVLDAGS